jgi:maltose alpha-D-glucosyltransferase/alpha-amylase
VLQEYLPNQGDAWQYTLDELSGFFERVLTLPAGADSPGLPLPHSARLLERARARSPRRAQEMFSNYLDAITLLGERTAVLHLALASDGDNPTFAPEPFSKLYQRSIYQSMRGLKLKVFEQLRQSLRELPADVQEVARTVLGRGEELLGRFRAVLERRLGGMRIRAHGDYHLGQVLYTGKDFAVIDFEGDATRPLTERRLSCSSLRDVATMVRSFHYAAYKRLARQADASRHDAWPDPSGGCPVLEPWALFWYAWVSAVFVRSYLKPRARHRGCRHPRSGLLCFTRCCSRRRSPSWVPS